jgi:hypothetical protein
MAELTQRRHGLARLTPQPKRRIWIENLSLRISHLSFGKAVWKVLPKMLNCVSGGGGKGRAGSPLPAAARTECAPCQPGPKHDKRFQDYSPDKHCPDTSSVSSILHPPSSLWLRRAAPGILGIFAANLWKCLSMNDLHAKNGCSR